LNAFCASKNCDAFIIFQPYRKTLMTSAI
jgi:hypothetical protein